MLIYINTCILLLYAVIVMSLILDVHITEVSKKNKLSAMAIGITFIIIDITVILTFGFKAYTKFFPILVQLPLVTIFVFLSRYRGAKLLFMLLSTITFSAPPIIVGMLTYEVFGDNYAIRMCAQIATYPFMLILIKTYFVPHFIYMLNYCEKGWISFSFIPFIYYLMTYIPHKYNFTFDTWNNNIIYPVGLCVMIYAVYFMILHVFKQMHEQFTMQNELDVFRLQAESATDRLNQISQSQEQMRIYRHDMRHHFQYINTCINNKQYDEAKQYISTLCDHIDHTRVESYCKNKAVNLIFSSYAQRAKQIQTKLNIKADIPEILVIPNLELCMIFSNAIENALNACENIKTDQKEITIFAEMRNNQRLFVSIKNPYQGEIQFENGLPITQKKGHGIGVKSISDTIEKYQGICNFTAEEGIFSFMMLI